MKEGYSSSGGTAQAAHSANKHPSLKECMYADGEIYKIKKIQ